MGHGMGWGFVYEVYIFYKNNVINYINYSFINSWNNGSIKNYHYFVMA